MTDQRIAGFKTEYDQHLPSIISSIGSMPGDISSIIPGMNKAKLVRFFQKFSIQLARIDKGQIKNPQYMWIDNQSTVANLLSIISTTQSNMMAGASQFLSSQFSQLTRIQDRLDRAIGADIDELKKSSIAVAQDLAGAAQRADEYIQTIEGIVSRAGETAKAIEENREFSEIAKRSLEQDSQISSQLRVKIENIITPKIKSGTGSLSIDQIMRKITETAAAIEELRVGSDKNNQIISEHQEKSSEFLLEMDVFRQSMGDIKSEAQNVLNLSIQAGLAASYKAEADERGKQVRNLTYFLYALCALTVAYAVFSIIPNLSSMIENLAGQNKFDFWEAFSITILRFLAIAPLLYMIFFTSRRISENEKLRMDYAEKAAASLAYSGYRDQMENDDDLLVKLKQGLIVKFSEHPARLLNQESKVKKGKISAAGLKGELEFSDPPKQVRTARRSKTNGGGVDDDQQASDGDGNASV